MQEVNSKAAKGVGKNSALTSFLRNFTPTRKNLLLALLSSFLLILAFPNFNLWFLAWVAFVPFLIALSNSNQTGKQVFALGLIYGTVFFVGTCYWLTYAMIHYGHIPTVIAYSLLVPAAVVISVFPALFSLALYYTIRRFSKNALLLAPFIWVAFEWLRFQITGQLWNAAGYSQAFVPWLIQTASWGSVYAVSFLIMLANAAIAYAYLGRKAVNFSIAGFLLVDCFLLIYFTGWNSVILKSPRPQATVIAIQPNVPMSSMSLEEVQELFKRHIELSETEFGKLSDDEKEIPRLVVWPESPMLFLYSRDSQLQETLSDFTKRNKASLIINSLEPAPNNGDYNSAMFINENGNLAMQYDKINLMPFGEYVPVPRWIPGAGYIPSMVGDFTAGKEYDLFPVGNVNAGIFICFESAFPNHTREFAKNGADVLIEMTNDGYLGPTPVLEQHLSNAVFRAVETNRPVVRVTNVGITALITERGEVKDAANSYEPTARRWNLYKTEAKTFYTKYGDVFPYACLLISALSLLISVFKRKSLKEN